MNKSLVSIGAAFCAHRFVLLAVAALLSLSACGSGGGTGAGAAPAQPQSIDPCSSDHGIEGGGRQILSGIVTGTDAAGRVTVSSVQFGTTGAKVLVDGAPASTVNVQPGNVATLTGAVDFSTRTGCAAAVFADAVVIGAIATVNAADQSLIVLGQPISIDADTVFGQELQPSGLSSLQIGDRIRVSGLRSNGAIVATRIDRDVGTDGYYVAGPLSDLDTVNREFHVGAIRIRYDAATLAGFPDDEPVAGNLVRVSGIVVVADDSTSPATLVLEPAQVELIAYSVPLEISPTNVSVPVGGTRQFEVSRGTGPVTWSVSDGHSSACTPQACGVIDSTGHYTAPTMQTSSSHLLITATSMSDPGITASAVVVLEEAPFSLGGLNTVSGEIFSAETGPVPGDVNVNLWVQQGDGSGYSYWWANGPLVAHDGLFQAPRVPDSYVTLWAAEPGYVQPCVVGAEVHGDITVQIELQPESAFASTNAPRPTQSVEPSLSGMIYESTNSGRQPVAGAKVWLVSPLDDVYAVTLSDAGGEYYLCNLGKLSTPSFTGVSVSKPGYTTLYVYPVPIAEAALLDIELKPL